MNDYIARSSQNDVISKHVITGVTNINPTKTKEIKENLEKYEQLLGTDEDSFVQPTTTKKELWAYYLYYNVCRPILHTPSILGSLLIIK